MIRERGLSGTGEPESSHSGQVDPEYMERMFQKFGEDATAFVREVSSAGAILHRGEPSALRNNVSLARKVFGKWSIEIMIATYSLRSARFGDLKRLLVGISPRVLSRKLKDLEQLGFVQREVLRSRPPMVRYTLSDRGEVLAKLGEPVILYLRRSVE